MVRKTRRRSTQIQPLLNMGFLTKLSGCVVLIVIMIGNILIFAKSVHLSDNILQLEKDISRLRKENQGLQKKKYAGNSLISLEYSARELGFTKQAEPVFFEKPNYAMAQ